MKQIFVFGDSNTWGQTSANSRYEFDARWINILSQKLGSGYDVYDAGLSGRVAGDHPSVPPIKRGKDAFEYVYRQTVPVDILIVALGTNDVKKKYDISAKDVCNDLFWYKETALSFKNYDGTDFNGTILYVLPPNFDADKFDGDEAKRKAINEMMKSSGVNFIELNDLSLSEDGVHFSKIGHSQMADAVFSKLQEDGYEI